MYRVLDKLTAEHVEMIESIYDGAVYHVGVSRVSQVAKDLGERMASGADIGSSTDVKQLGLPTSQVFNNLKEELSELQSKIILLEGKTTDLEIENRQLRSKLSDVNELMSIATDEDYGKY
ncbi:MAG: hypothetical protein JJ979_03505 [Roseibium sp.]|nr:hypothetical protein [Roseibium sp.]